MGGDRLQNHDGGGMTTLQRYSRAQTSPSSHYASELIRGALISPGLRSVLLPFISKENNTNKNVSGSALKMHEMRSSSPVVITASLARRARAVIK